MTPQELATFLREEVPRLRSIPKSSGRLPRHIDEIRVEGLLSALDAAVGLLRKAETELTASGYRDLGTRQLLATLRLVVGEKETG